MHPSFALRMRPVRVLPIAILIATLASPAPASERDSGAAGLAALAWLQAPQDGERAGLGVGLRLRDGAFVVEQLAPNGAAAKAGVLVGDRIAAIDGKSLMGLSLEEAAQRIQGEVGSKVKLEVVRGERTVRLTAVRLSLGRTAPGGDRPNPPRQDEPEPATPPAGQALTLVRRVVVDPAVENRPGFTFVVPSTWRAEGGVVWDHNTSMLANLRLELEDPKTGMRLSWLPNSHFSFVPNPPVPTALGTNWMGALFYPAPQDAGSFVQTYFVPRVLPHLRGLTPVGVESRPKVAAEYMRGQQGWTASALRVRYEYEQRGKAFEEDVYFVLNFGPNTGTGMQSWNVQGSVAVRAPKGQLDRRSALVSVLITNTAYTPEWLASYGIVRQLFRQSMIQWQNDTVRFGQQLQQYRDQIAAQSQQIHEDRMRSFDRIAESQREYLGGVETYTDPYDQRGIYMPAGYKSYWVNQKGEYLLSEQTGYDPNVGSTDEWRKMPRRDPMRR